MSATTEQARIPRCVECCQDYNEVPIGHCASCPAYICDSCRNSHDKKAGHHRIDEMRKEFAFQNQTLCGICWRNFNAKTVYRCACDDDIRFHGACSGDHLKQYRKI
jgi:hypothetical protein